MTERLNSPFSLGGTVMVLTVFLVVVLAALSAFLGWQRLIARDGLTRDRSWRMWSGPPEHQRYLAEVMDHEDKPLTADVGNIDPSPPPVS